MSRSGIIASSAALVILVAAAIGWRGSRPTSPIAELHRDGVTVVPATGTLRHDDAVPAEPGAGAPSPVPTAPAAATTVPAATVDAATADIDPEKLAAAFDRQPRDPAWAPGAEAALRNGFAGIPHLDGALAIGCRATLCRLTGGVPGGLAADEADMAVAMLQARAGGQVRRADRFGGSSFRLDQDNATGRAAFTMWLVRR